MKRLFLILITLTTAFLAAGSAAESERSQLEMLDMYLKQRDSYVRQKEDRLETGRQRLHSASTDIERFHACMALADEFFSYRFDSTQHYLKQAISLSLAMDRPVCAQQAGIRLGYLYTKAGNYMEAYDRLFLQTDTSRLSEELKIEYYTAVYEFSRDVSGNSGMVERIGIPEPAFYRRRLMALVPEESMLALRLHQDQCMEDGRYAQADSLGHQLLSRVPAQSHEAAICYYNLSEIAWREHRPQDQERYLILSAQCDIVNAIKDYASLSVLAQAYIDKDVDRAFHFLRIAQEDAILYNAKLRPWQISQFFMTIEDHYEARQAIINRWRIAVMVLLALLVLLLGAAVNYAARKRRQLSLAHDKLREAGQVKENYITRFLGDLSTHVATLRQEENRYRKLLKQGRSEELLHALSQSSRADDALDGFYQIFDKTFLDLYPGFVEQFNALLRPEARIVLKKEGQLTTELRIFALIRLGIDDSKEIARLLHYSLSTIYNYKVAVKNGALDRDTFEQKVKEIK